MSLQLIIATSVLCATYIPSFILMLLIRKYHKEKPPGLQTILDLLIVDSANLFLFFNAISVIFFASSTFELHNIFPVALSLTLFYLLSNSLVLFLTSLQAGQIVKALLIFKPGFFERYLDKKVLQLSRLFIVGYSILRLFIALMSPPVSTGWTKAITGTDDKL